jgi:hypothetical protein
MFAENVSETLARLLMTNLSSIGWRITSRRVCRNREIYRMGENAYIGMRCFALVF